MPSKKIKPRTRNSGKMTEAQFWSMIRSALRKLTIYWQPIKEAKIKARRKVSYGRHKWEYLCSSCGKWFKEKEIEVHHIEEVGVLRSYDDLPEFVRKLFAEEGYQVMCKECHKIKTQQHGQRTICKG